MNFNDDRGVSNRLIVILGQFSTSGMLLFVPVEKEKAQRDKLDNHWRASSYNWLSSLKLIHSCGF